jgi:PAS domain S-box-containing protein
MSPIPAIDRAATRSVREWLFLATALLMLGGGIGWSLYADRQELEDEERERLSRRASMIDENIRRQLFATNRALESIRRDLPRLKAQKDSTGLINDRLQALTEVMPGVRTLLIYDADATVLASNRKELIGQTFRERAYIKAALQSRNPAVLHLSAPYTTALGAFAMTAVKLIADGRGQVVGMVGVTIDPDYFKTLLHSVVYAPDMRVSITHSDGRLFALVPEQAGRQGLDLAQPGSFFTRHRNSGQQEVLLTGIAYTTGDERMMALRTIKPADLLMDKTLVVSVARNLPAIFAVWRRDAYEKAMLFGLISLISTGGLFLIQRRQREYARVVAGDEVERQKVEAFQRKSESLFRNYFTLGQVGMAITSVEKGWLDVNGRLCEMLGYPKEELLKKTWLELTHPDDVEPDLVQFNRLLSGQIERYAMDKRFLHKNGSIVHIHLTVACQRNPDNSVEYVIASLQDITERKQAEARSHESENWRISEQAAALEAQRKARLAAQNLMADAVAARGQAEVAAATLEKQLDELHRWQQVTLGREGRVLAMKKEVNSLLAELGQPPRYPSAAEAETEK